MRVPRTRPAACADGRRPCWRRYLISPLKRAPGVLPRPRPPTPVPDTAGMIMSGTAGPLRIEADDLGREEVRRLVAEHLLDMHATSPAESVHALDHAELR